jgi:glycine oxidase
MGRSSDIIVIGAGVVGCAVAYELARRGASVEIIDERVVGMGATQASAGVLAPYIEARDGGPLLELTARSLDLFDTFIAQVTRDSGAEVAYHRTGSIDVALEDGTVELLAEAAATLHERGVSAVLLDATTTLEEEPQLTGAVRGALLIPVHGFVAAIDLTRALVAAAERYGARLAEHQRVRRLVATGQGITLETDGGSIVGARVVVAAGSWSGKISIEGAAAAPVRPVRGQLLQLGWDGPPLTRVTWGERCYLVPRENGTLLVGATVEEVGFDERTTVSGVRRLLDAACELAPAVGKASLQAARAGLRPASTDQLPIIGPSTAVPNLFYATGHFRNGVLLAPLTATLVADAVLEGRMDRLLEATRPARFGRL